jgi:hypothetical protein
MIGPRVCFHHFATWKQIVQSERLGTLEGKYVTGCVRSKNLEGPKDGVFIDHRF